MKLVCKFKNGLPINIRPKDAFSSSAQHQFTLLCRKSSILAYIIVQSLYLDSPLYSMSDITSFSSAPPTEPTVQASASSAVTSLQSVTRSTISILETVQSRPSARPTSIIDDFGCPSDEAPSPLRNQTGLQGRACWTQLQPRFVGTESCCKEGTELRLQDSCVQHCEVPNDTGTSEFLRCVTQLVRNNSHGNLDTRPRLVLCDDFPKSTATSSSTAPTESFFSSFLTWNHFADLSQKESHLGQLDVLSWLLLLQLPLSYLVWSTFCRFMHTQEK